jgi:hypothetical protein
LMKQWAFQMHGRPAELRKSPSSANWWSTWESNVGVDERETEDC